MIVDSIIRVYETELSRREWRDLFAALTFEDADGVEVQAYDHRPGAGLVRIPRGALDLIPDVERFDDRRPLPLMRKLAHTKELDVRGFTGQKAALRSMFLHEQGQIRLSTGAGKTTIGCAFIAAAGTKTLVLAHTKDLVRQWAERAVEEIPGIDVTTIDAKHDRVGHLTVSTMQTMRERYLDAPKEFWRQFGALIVDESHHTAASSYEWILNTCPAYYRFGFSASSKRSDGRMKLVRFNVGPVIYSAPFKSQVPIEIQPVFTNFRSRYNAVNYSKLVRELVEDEERNALVAQIAAEQSVGENSVLVLSRQIKHLELIAEQMPPEMDGHFAIVTGNLSSLNRKKMIDALRSGELRAILGTQLFEEGVDVPRLNRLVLAYPGTDVTTLQKVGRVTRSFKGKTSSLVIDLVDAHVAVFVRQYTTRKQWYKQSKTIVVKKAIDERRYHAKKEDGLGWRDKVRRRRASRA